MDQDNNGHHAEQSDESDRHQADRPDDRQEYDEEDLETEEQEYYDDENEDRYHDDQEDGEYYDEEDVDEEEREEYTERHEPPAADEQTAALAPIDEDEAMDLAEEADGGGRMTLAEHLEELRKRIFWALVGLVAAMALGLYFGKEIIDVLQGPYLAVTGKDTKLTFLSVVEPIAMYFRISLVAGLIAASPWIFYQLWQFVAVGLYPRERRYVYLSIPFSVSLFVLGSLFFQFVVCEPILRFMIGLAEYMGTRSSITLKNYISFVARMMIVFGIAFQTPLLILVLVKVGLVSTKTLNRYRRHVIIGMLIFAAVFTTPSPVDQILLAVPMWLLFELGLLLSYIFVTAKRSAELDE